MLAAYTPSSAVYQVAREEHALVNAVYTQDGLLEPSGVNLLPEFALLPCDGTLMWPGAKRIGDSIGRSTFLADEEIAEERVEFTRCLVA